MNSIKERTETGRKRGRPGRSPVITKLQKKDVIHSPLRKSTSDPNLISTSMADPINQPSGSGAGPSNAPASNIKNLFKTIEVPNVPTNNRFDPLSPKPNDNIEDNNDSEIELQTKPTETTKKNSEDRRKPPPIVIHSTPPSHKELIDELKAHIKKGFHVKYTLRKTNLFIHDLDEYREYIKILDNAEMEFHTYADKDQKHHAFVLAGLPRDVSVDEIKEDIESSYNIKIIKVYAMKTAYRPLYLIITEQNITLKHITQKVRYVSNIKVTWEKHRNSKVIIQCHRCQEWGHGTTLCRVSPKCLKCAGPHWSRECSIKEHNEENQKKLRCINCKQNHTANSTQCPIYIAKIEQIERRKRPNNAPAKTAVPKYIPAPIPTTNPWSMGNPFNRTAQNQQQIRTTAPPTDYAHGHGSTNLQIHTQPSTSNNIYNLIGEFDELNKMIDIDRMFAYVKELNNQLRSCNNELEKFITFNNFCKKYFSASGCPP